MAAPKIKLYRLSRDFTTDSLNRDKKTEINDELLPVFDKYVSPDDIMANRAATGILPSEGRYVEKLTKILSLPFGVSGSGRIIANLILQETQYSNSLSESYSQYSNSVSVSDIQQSNSASYSGSGSLNSGIYLVQLSPEQQSSFGNIEVDFCFNDGVYPLVMSGDEVIPSSGWESYKEDGETYIRAIGKYCYYVFTTVTFTNIASGSTTLYCSKYAPVYDGKNSYFKPFIFTIKDGFSERTETNIVDGIDFVSNTDAEMDFYTRASSDTLEDGDYYIYADTGEIVISQTMMNDIPDKDLYFSYVAVAHNGTLYRDTKRFISEFVNLIPQNDENGTPGGHLFMGPDVFIGKKQYEPSSYEDADTGEVINIGIIPAYVEPGNYSFYHRNGYVVFPAKVNSNPEYNTADYSWNLDNLSYTKNGTYTKIGGSVHISHAHVCCVENVNGQVFEKYYSYEDIHGEDSNSVSSSDIVENLRPGDVVFRASASDKRYLNSIGAPWVKRNTSYMPTNVYVTYKKGSDASNSNSGSGSSSGSYEVVTELKPQVITIPNYDELTVKMG